MNSFEAEKVAKIMLTADSWCGTCSDRLLDQLILAFPDHAVAIQAVRKNADEIERRFSAAQEAWDYGPVEAEPRVWDF